MKVRILSALTATAAAWAGATAQEPTKLPLKADAAAIAKGDAASDRALADTVVRKLDKAGMLATAEVKIVTVEGVITLTGTVPSDKQKQEILEIVRYVPGVKQVRDGLKVGSVKPSAKPKIDPPTPMPPPSLLTVSGKDGGDQVMNQSLADEVATKLDSSNAMTGADVQIFTSNGTCTLVGTCRTDKQKQEILEVARHVSGVKQVRDGLKVSAVRQVQATGPGGAVGPLATPAPSGMPPLGGGDGGFGPEPVPVGPGGGFGGYEGAAPPLPPYAWPTYAPHNNVSRVAYPEAYPYNAFPFIGPFYPFPKVPLGWRKVTLEWEDGHWWLGRKQAPIDYWRVRFGN